MFVRMYNNVVIMYKTVYDGQMKTSLDAFNDTFQHFHILTLGDKMFGNLLKCSKSVS